MVNIIKQQLLQNSIFYVIALFIAFGLKYHYSQASSDDLTWILRPTTGLVEQISGIHFEKEEGTGYINKDHRIIIAPSCAGVNFFIIAFCMTVCSFIHYFKRGRVKVFWLWSSFVGAYLLTLVANAFRIIVAIHLYHTEIYSGWFTQERLHRLEGIVVYFSLLCIFYVIIQKIIHLETAECNGIVAAESPISPRAGRDACAPRKGSISERGLGEGEQKTTRPPDKFKYLRFICPGLIPAFWYLLIILLVPLLNAAYRKDIYRFIEHSSIVFTGCLAVVIVVVLVQLTWNRIANKR